MKTVLPLVFEMVLIYFYF